MSFAALETVGVDFKIEYNAALDVLDAASFPYLRETGATVGAEGFNEFAVADNAELREIRDAFPRLQKVAQTLRIMYLRRVDSPRASRGGAAGLGREYSLGTFHGDAAAA